jgi:hypothetical protein
MVEPNKICGHGRAKLKKDHGQAEQNVFVMTELNNKNCRGKADDFFS